VEEAQLFLVALEILEPEIEFQVIEFVFEFPPDELRGFDFLIGVRNLKIKFKLVGFRVLFRHRLVTANFALEIFNFADGPLHGDFERTDGVFETFQEIHFHHALVSKITRDPPVPTARTLHQ
jgi:hypothetical protein